MSFRASCKPFFMKQKKIKNVCENSLNSFPTFDKLFFSTEFLKQYTHAKITRFTGSLLAANPFRCHKVLFFSYCRKMLLMVLRKQVEKFRLKIGMEYFCKFWPAAGSVHRSRLFTFENSLLKLKLFSAYCSWTLKRILLVRFLRNVTWFIDDRLTLVFFSELTFDLFPLNQKAPWNDFAEKGRELFHSI